MKGTIKQIPLKDPKDGQIVIYHKQVAKIDAVCSREIICRGIKGGKFDGSSNSRLLSDLSKLVVQFETDEINLTATQLGYGYCFDKAIYKDYQIVVSDSDYEQALELIGEKVNFEIEEIHYCRTCQNIGLRHCARPEECGQVVDEKVAKLV